MLGIGPGDKATTLERQSNIERELPLYISDWVIDGKATHREIGKAGLLGEGGVCVERLTCRIGHLGDKINIGQAQA